MFELSGDPAARESALQFLDEMEVRHDFLLTELEKLNANIESVLAEYAKSRLAAPASIPQSASAAILLEAPDAEVPNDD